MNKKIKSIEKQLVDLQNNLDNAKKYLEKGENIKSSSSFHLSDWHGFAPKPPFSPYFWGKNAEPSAF